MDTMTEAERFFYDHAGYSHNPATETAEEGRVRGARALAQAERWLSEQGLEVAWEGDPDAEEMDRGTEHDGWPQYQASIEDEHGNVLSSLGSVMLADLGSPWGSDPYVRVVEAELALEAMTAGPVASETTMGLTLTRDQLTEWAGRPLSDADVARLAVAVPHSSIPAAVHTIVDSFDFAVVDNAPDGK